MTSPLSFGNGNILIRGISITAKNKSGLDLQLDSVLSGITLRTSNQSVDFASMPAASTGYFPFPFDVTVTASAGETISIFAGIKTGTFADSLQLMISADTAISAYQDNDPLRQVFIAPASGETFPMSSGIGYITGDSGGLSFSAYPVPFSKNQPCKIGYYLASASAVTINIYDSMGNHVKTIIKDKDKAAGSHSEDTWDGADKNSRTVLPGIYLIKIEAGSLGSASAKVMFIK
jgi:hypothetical protein